ncbi:beta-galactosidase [bacterium]|nr:beta-galactosidase [bacterium]
MRTSPLVFLACAALCCGLAYPAADMPLAPSWEQAPAAKFTSAGGAVLADGAPMPLLMDFTWSAPEGEAMVHYQSQFLGTAHWRSVSVVYDGNWNWERLDALYDWAARHRVYLVLGLNVQQGVGYVRKDPTASARTADGKAVESNVSFMHEGYRQVLVRALTELADHVRNKPYHLGYYPQDEFAYRALSGYEPCSLAAFRDWVVKQRGGLAQVNQAWGKQFASAAGIQPPSEKEPTLAWADWQEFRRWAQMDFTRLVYDTLKQADPDHVVIWSLPFMGWYADCASWWRFPPVSDVLMRHGIGYSTGIFRLKMLSALAQWSGKPANALCMPPEYNPSFVQMSFLMDGPQSGLSHVCTAGTIENGPYMGSADPRDNWRRREPLYTRSRSLNDLWRQMGPTLLSSRPRTPQVGVSISDRQVLLEGLNLNSLNGVLQLLADLNLDTEVFSELSWDRLKQYRAVVLGSFSRCADAKMAADLQQFVQAGGVLVVTDGALATDENNLPADRGLDEFVGSTEAARAELKEPIAVAAHDLTRGLTSLPSLGQVSFRKPASGTTVLADVPSQGAVVTLRPSGKGRILFCGADFGLPYQAGYTEDFAGVTRPTDKQTMDEQAGFHFDPTRGAEQALGLQAHKAWGMLVRSLLASAGLTPRVQVKQYGDAIGAVKALSFRSGKDYWIGLANRLVRPGKDCHRDAPEEYHQVLTGVQVALAPDADAAPRFAVVLPDGAQTAAGFSAVPQMLKLSGNAFTLPRLTDYKMVLLTAGHDPVLGLEVAPRRAVRGQSFKLAAHAVNPSAQAVRLDLVVDASPGLQAGQKLTLSCPPGGAASASCTVAVGPQTQPGYETLQLVATYKERRLFSPSAEIEIAPDVTLQVTGADRTLFPAEEGGSRISVVATNNRPEAGTLTADVQVADGYAATPANLRLALPPGQTMRSELVVKAGPTTPPLAEGRLSVVTQSGSARDGFQRSLRLARGVVAYVDTRPVRLAAAEDSRRPVGLACLENRHLRAEFIPQSGTLHSLIPRFAGRDFLLEGDYPIGLVWYGAGNYAQTELIADDQQARLVLTGGPGGKTTLTATLGRDDRQLQCVWDATAVGLQTNTFYLMSHLSLLARSDTLVAPEKGALARLPRGSRTIAAEQLAAPWVAAESGDGQEVLGVAFDFPALQQVTLRPGGGGYNYMLFGPKAEPPGKMTFWLTGLQGNAQAVADWAAQLPRP